LPFSAANPVVSKKGMDKSSNDSITVGFQNDNGSIFHNYFLKEPYKYLLITIGHCQIHVEVDLMSLSWAADGEPFGY
jgi:hypothetical protein